MLCRVIDVYGRAGFVDSDDFKRWRHQYPLRTRTGHAFNQIRAKIRSGEALSIARENVREIHALRQKRGAP